MPLSNKGDGTKESKAKMIRQNGPKLPYQWEWVQGGPLPVIYSTPKNGLIYFVIGVITSPFYNPIHNWYTGPPCGANVPMCVNKCGPPSSPPRTRPCHFCNSGGWVYGLQILRQISIPQMAMIQESKAINNFPAAPTTRSLTFERVFNSDSWNFWW